MCSEDSCADLRVRNCPRCKKQFAICRSCDRGHVYCSKRCSRRARWESLREARRRHRKSPDGRLDHQDRERARRARKQITQRSVGDHGSADGSTSCSVTAPPSLASDSAGQNIGGDAENENDLRCAICGTPGRFIRFGFWQQSYRKDFRFRC